MTDDKFAWVDKKEESIKEERSNEYFSIVEGKQTFVLLTHFAQLAQVWDGKKYRPAEEGDTGVSVKGVCYVLQDGKVKQAKMPYTVVKQVRELSQNPDWEFAFPFPHALTLSAIGAGTKEVDYSLTASPKKVEIPKEVTDELAKKWTPEEVVEKIKGKREVSPSNSASYPTEEVDPADSPF